MMMGTATTTTTRLVLIHHLSALHRPPSGPHFMESFTYDCFPSHLSSIHAALFTPISNGSQLRSRIIGASTMEGDEGDRERDALNFAFIDAKLVR